MAAFALPCRANDALGLASTVSNHRLIEKPTHNPCFASAAQQGCKVDTK